jgi:hypothetical protein
VRVNDKTRPAIYVDAKDFLIPFRFEAAPCQWGKEEAPRYAPDFTFGIGVSTISFCFD